MKRTQLLDCTLRDGGYLNDWNFGHDTLISIFERLISAGTDVIEIGFLNSSRDFDINRSIMPNTDCAEKIYGQVDKGDSMIVGMIDYGTCPIENISPCEDSYIDGIRVIFKEHLMYEALDFCQQIKDLGYIVFAQLVSVTSYTDEKLSELVKRVNELKPYALSMVDTYGLTHSEDIIHIFRELDRQLLPGICIGYHAHNNFQLGYANGIAVLSEKTERPVLVDGTLYGMGKSAGNTPVELLAMYMNEKHNKHYNIEQYLEAIETNIVEIQKSVQWGYNMFYYVSASTHCHPNYVSYFMNKGTLSMKSINELLLSLDRSKSLLYDVKYAEKKYLEYQQAECNDEKAMESLKEIFYGKAVVVFGPGETIVSEQNSIQKYVENHSDLIPVSINYIPNDTQPQYIFITNSKRYSQNSTALTENRDVRTIATSNVTKSQGVFDYELNYSKLIDPETEVPDNSLVMLLKVLIQCEVKKVSLIGFDGYSAEKMNYFNTNREYDSVKHKAEYLNSYMNQFLSAANKDIDIEFVTTTRYK